MYIYTCASRPTRGSISNYEITTEHVSLLAIPLSLSSCCSWILSTLLSSIALFTFSLYWVKLCKHHHHQATLLCLGLCLCLTHSGSHELCIEILSNIHAIWFYSHRGVGFQLEAIGRSTVVGETQRLFIVVCLMDICSRCQCVGTPRPRPRPANIGQARVREQHTTHMLCKIPVLSCQKKSTCVSYQISRCICTCLVPDICVLFVSLLPTNEVTERVQFVQMFATHLSEKRCHPTQTHCLSSCALYQSNQRN
jgi:hypothetical protein